MARPTPAPSEMPNFSKFPIRFLAGVLALTTLVLILLAFNIYDTYRFARDDLPRLRRLEALRGSILHLDEVLTMSARMAAATGDLAWETRYNEFEPQLARDIREATELASFLKSEDPVQTDVANVRLMEMERKSFALVRAGKAGEATQILFGSEYEAQKRIYADGMAQLDRRLSGDVEFRVANRRQRTLYAWGAVGALLPALLVAWVAVGHRVRGWQRSLTELNDRVLRRTADLAELNCALDLRVTERTATLRRSEEELSVRVSLAELVADIGSAVATGKTMRAELQKCTESIVQRLDAAFARIWTLNARDNMLELQASAGMYTNIHGGHARVPVGKFKIGLIAQEGKPHLTNSVIGDPRVPEQEWAMREGLISFAGYPLIADRRVVGVVALFARHALSEVTLRALAAVADVLAVGIQRRRDEEDMRQSQKLDAIGRLAGGVAHDYNNMTTVVLGYTDLLLSKPGIDAPFRSLLQEIRGAAQRSAALTAQLLAFSRRQVLAPKVVSLNACVTSVEGLVRRLIGEDIKLEIALEPDPGMVKADPGQLEQVIINLAVNARDAMPRGGSLSLRVQNGPAESLGSAPLGFCRLSVRDSGIGMDEATRAHIFEPFFTTKERGKGTGLGLAVVHGIIEQSGGRVAVSSAPGRGTTFDIFLPRVAEAPEAEHPHAPPDLGAKASETVLVVEDEEMVRNFTRDALEMAGYRVLLAAHGQDGLRLAREYAGPIHLLLTDVVMPEMDGRTLADALGAVRPGLRTLYMSGYTDDAVVRHGIIQVGTNFLEKPFTPVSLNSKVREVLDR